MRVCERRDGCMCVRVCVRERVDVCVLVFRC